MKALPDKSGVPWFSTPERIAALVEEAKRWVGTPFFCNGNTPGPRGGVSCQKLAGELYRRCGWRTLNVPEVQMAHARFAAKRSLLDDFMLDCPHFESRGTAGNGNEAQAGDLLCLRIGRVSHHCGVMLENGRFIHAMEHLGTMVNSLAEPTWFTALNSVWRPIE